MVATMTADGKVDFDDHVREYKAIIDRGSALTGETFEYFIRLRVGVMAARLETAGVVAPRRILDFGCGIGATGQALRERFPTASLDGVDSSAASLDAARALNVSDARFHFSEGPTLPFEDETFDVIYSNGTFHHIDHAEHPAVFRELARVLRRGGHAFVFENNPLNPLTVRGMRQNPFDAGTKMLFPWYLRRQMGRPGLRARAPQYYVFFPKQLKMLRWAEDYLRHVPLGAQYYVWASKVDAVT